MRDPIDVQGAFCSGADFSCWWKQTESPNKVLARRYAAAFSQVVAWRLLLCLTRPVLCLQLNHGGIPELFVALALTCGSSCSASSSV
jgi:hypothetical protein